MRVIFLDVDGVLNSIESSLVLGTTNTLCPIRVGMVKRLCHKAEAHIVVSSSWRNPGVEGTKEALRRAGGDSLIQFIVGQTPKISGPRGGEIAAWLTAHPEVTSYVILDDDDDMLPDQHFVQTSMACGFGLDEYLDALNILAPTHADLHPLRGLESYRGHWKRKREPLFTEGA